VLNLRDLMLAPARQPLTDLMCPTVERVTAGTRVAGITLHPGLRRFRVLPVVEQSNRLVGVLSSMAVERPERLAIPARAGGPGSVGIGLAHLLWTLNATLLDRLFSAARAPRSRPGARGEP
jgi:hypothetical protein